MATIVLYIFHLLISCIEAQRVTIYSWPFTNNVADWNVSSNIDQSLVTSSLCPGASTCSRIRNDNELYTHLDTRGYTDIEIGYDIRTSNLGTDDRCEFYWKKGPFPPYEGTWTRVGSHTTNTNPESALHTLPDNVDNYESIAIDFWADMGANGYCYINNVLVTGIATTDPGRDELFSWLMWLSDENADGWTADGSNQGIVSATKCPGGGSCYYLSNDNAVYRNVDTTGYEDIYITYSMRTEGLVNNDGCAVYYDIGSGEVVLRSQGCGPFCNAAQYNMILYLAPGVSNNANWKIGFWADMAGTKTCFINYIILTGIPIVSHVSEPSPAPTPVPTPLPTQTLLSSHSPTRSPTFKPTPNPTPNPTLLPTPKPTDPDTLTCGDSVTGPYSGEAVTFLVHIPFDEEYLQFDASASSFIITDIEGFTKLNVLLKTDVDNDETVTLMNTPAGDYKFIIYGEGTQSGTFEATIRCFSSNPTTKATQNPTTISSQPSMLSNPTVTATKKPTQSTSKPTLNPVTTPATPSPNNAETTDMVIGTANSATTTAFKEGRGDGNSGVPIGHPSTIQIAIIIVSVAAICCICCCVLLLCYKRFSTVQARDQREISMVDLRTHGTEPPSNIVPMDDNEEVAFEREIVISWLQNTVKLPQYTQIFVENGYDNMRAIQAIERVTDLEVLGVHSLGHKAFILSEIKKIKGMGFETKGITKGGDVISPNEAKEKERPNRRDNAIVGLAPIEEHHDEEGQGRLSFLSHSEELFAAAKAIHVPNDKGTRGGTTCTPTKKQQGKKAQQQGYNVCGDAEITSEGP
eukprot:918699_1